ncbi:type VI secretion protein IcmF/TssM N-terminal domain-containing protein [Chromohalobacter nigrandesensis]|uniref:type VI secretion protein IcmF/TssM N-terminal domain-containing protein n=1 Tax=Chromohalobacter nigrandesensis TaxID=119863 RepID=UPI001FF448EE|nr:type VI secretion protein IcmF/TssM N-terminal domain-containing protein [Chromohalobacter nigrandesensis]MCK0746717.1 ImcF-like protein [Chromohalobacter nigrandesensis]
MRFLRFLRSLKGFWPLSIVLWLVGLALCVLLLPLLTSERELIFIAMALVTATWLLVVVLRQYHRIRAERNIENLVELEVHREAAESESGDYQVLSERLKHAMAMQRAARSVDGGKASLYELPWYLVIGMAASGKTSLLTRSSLSATMAGGSNLSSVSGTQHCDWYFSREAVMVDTAGRYLVEDRPASEFSDFLKTLRKQRRKPAINGLVLVVSLPELLEQSREDAHALAEKLVSRVAEYRACLGVNPPIYLFFSKVDLLPGFTRTFEALDARERQRPWGLTFSLDELRDQGVSNAFHERFPGLVDTLRHRVDRRVVEVGTAADSELLRFPDYFAELRGVLSDFLEQFDSQHNTGQAPILRGVYFTSALQTGPTLPALLDEQTREAFALEPEPASESTGPEGEKSYFITDTFREIVFPDRNLSLYYSQRGDRRSLPTFMIGTVGLIGMAAVAAQGWTAYNNKQWVDQLQDRVDALTAGNSTGYLDASERQTLRDELEHKLATIERYRDGGVPLKLDLGLYQGERLREPLKRAWSELMRRDVLEPLQKRLERQLRLLAVFDDRSVDNESLGTAVGDEQGTSSRRVSSGASTDHAASSLDDANAQGQAIGQEAVDRMQSRSTSKPTLGGVPSSPSELGSRARSELRSRTTDSARDAWYSARSNAETDLEQGLRDRTNEMSASAGGTGADDESALMLSGEQGPSLSEELLTQLSQRDVEQLIESYSALKLYLILTDPAEHRDQGEFVASALPKLWSNLAEWRDRDADGSSIEDNAELYVHYLEAGVAPALERDASLVAESRDRLNAFLIDSSLVDREYLRYQLAVEEQYDPLTLSRMVPDMPGRLFYSSRAVPAFFTRQAWEEYLRPAIIKTVSGDLQRESDWVLDDENVDDAVQTKARFVSQLMTRYKRDYAIAWERFLANTHVADFDTLDQASERLSELSDLRGSPLRQVLVSVKDNTGWDDPEDQDDVGNADDTSSEQGFWGRVMSVFNSDGGAAKTVDMASLPKIKDGTLARHFRPVSRMLSADKATGSDDSVLNQYLLDLRQLKVRVDNVQSAQDTGRSSKLLIMETLSGKPTEVNALRNFVASRVDTSRTPLVEALKPLFQKPIESTWKALNEPARDQLNTAWDDKIATPWDQMIAGRYPVADSVNEASVRDMEHFIDPDQGVLSKFREEEIGDLAGSSSGERSDMVDPRMLSSIDDATELGRVIDSLSDLRNGFEIQVNPTAGLTDIILTIDGQRIHYRNNTQSWERLTWPGKGESFGARLDIINKDGRRHTVFDYPSRWGFLHMIESAHVMQIDGARQRFSWRTYMGTISFDVRNFGGVKISDLRQIKALKIPKVSHQ